MFKKGNRHDPVNYRPVSLTSICFKLLEHIVCSHVRAHLDRYNILSRFQHRFRKLRSCEIQLITVFDLMTYYDKKVQVDVVILYFPKAFDVVPHERLLQKLPHCWIRGNIHTWITSFLKDRSQCVKINGVRLDKVHVGPGVPQGTAMGPLLLLLYINDLPNEVSSHVHLFVDDCLLYRPIRSEDDQANLQQDLDSRWAETWGMRFNLSN